MCPQNPASGKIARIAIDRPDRYLRHRSAPTTCTSIHIAAAFCCRRGASGTLSRALGDDGTTSTIAIAPPIIYGATYESWDAPLSSASRPASVIVRQATSVGRPRLLMFLTSTVASPLRMRSPNVSNLKPRLSKAFTSQPRDALASIFSTRRCSGPMMP